ncbi:hypothetical protein OAD98_01030 [Flavobacteriales bacterium]|nr:hypothetical protein [Flavobacteriales bacterium]MDB9702329.1 hypothetical protein [Flavobacteriales bacterium]MDB9932244.1 hypothetical protein [Flavobacteriales bacterium]MDC0015126.1 hypothetical protein [Flavobacteriales bacterium]
MKTNIKHILKATINKGFMVAFLVSISFLSQAQIFNDSLLNDTSSNVINLLGADYQGDNDGDLKVAKFVGNVRLMQDSVFMRCDVGYLDLNFEFLKAVGNVKINQGDSIYLYGDSLDYNGLTKIAFVRGNVRLEKGDITLTAPSLRYDINTNIASYFETGKVVSKANNNTLTSKRGYYYSNEKKLSFKDSVTLTNPEYVMTSDTLNYEEDSEIAYFFGNTFIKGDGNLIFCKNGFYDTKNDISEFNKDAYLISDGHTIIGDKLYYDRNKGVGKAIGNISLTDTTNKIIITGDYGIRNEQTNTSFVTGKPMVSNWFEEGDTLFLTADTIKLLKNEETKKNSLFCFNSVRFFKNDIQGICDSMTYLQSDSVIQLFQNPFIWSENSQMNGDTIFINLQNNKIDELNLRRNSFIIEAIASLDSLSENSTDQFNQIKGKNIKALFSEDTIRRVFVTGNGQSIYFTGENNQPKQGLNKIDCSDIEIRFNENKIKEILFKVNPDGTLFPIQDVTKENEKLKGFVWNLDLKPKSKEDLILLQSNE